MPPTRTPCTHILSQQLTYTGQLKQLGWLILQQYSIVRLHIKAHVLQKKTSFSQILTEPGFLRKLCHSLLLTDQTELSPTKVSLFTTNLYQLFSQVGEFWPQMYSLSLSLHSRQPTQSSIQHENGWGLECQKVNFLEPWNLPCRSSSSLPFGHFSSPTNITTHSSQLFTHRKWKRKLWNGGCSIWLLRLWKLVFLQVLAVITCNINLAILPFRISVVRSPQVAPHSKSYLSSWQPQCSHTHTHTLQQQFLELHYNLVIQSIHNYLGKALPDMSETGILKLHQTFGTEKDGLSGSSLQAITCFLLQLCSSV